MWFMALAVWQALLMGALALITDHGKIRVVAVAGVLVAVVGLIVMLRRDRGRQR